MKNPRQPFASTIRTEHSGEWDGSYEPNNHSKEQRPVVEPIPVFGRPRVHKDVWEYQHSKTPEVLEDKALDAAIQRDLQSRNLKQPKPTE